MWRPAQEHDGHDQLPGTVAIAGMAPLRPAIFGANSHRYNFGQPFRIRHSLALPRQPNAATASCFVMKALSYQVDPARQPYVLLSNGFSDNLNVPP